MNKQLGYPVPTVTFTSFDTNIDADKIGAIMNPRYTVQIDAGFFPATPLSSIQSIILTKGHQESIDYTKAVDQMTETMTHQSIKQSEIVDDMTDMVSQITNSYAKNR